MSRSKTWRNKFLYGKETRQVKAFPEHQAIFIKAVTAAILHARRVTKRQHHWDCAKERVGVFVTSLRRELSLISYDRMVTADLCQYDRWDDAGYPNYRVDKKYTSFIEEARMQADQQQQQSMDEIKVVLEKEEDIIAKMKSISQEADKLFTDIKGLVSNF
jgi:hypothetical protein